MAQSTKVSACPALSSTDMGEDDRWSPPRTAMFVVVTSASLWSLIFAGVRWLIG